ncbi:MAG: hypothetical protein ACK52I_23970 [Pseudomonadota bacterium]
MDDPRATPPVFAGESAADLATESARDPHAAPGEAAAVLQALAAGLHPLNGSSLRADAAWNLPAVRASLAEGAVALQSLERQRARRARLPPNVGKPWSASDDARLLEAFDAREDLEAIATALGRTRTGVRSRLERHGRLAPPAPVG